MSFDPLGSMAYRRTLIRVLIDIDNSSPNFSLVARCRLVSLALIALMILEWSPHKSVQGGVELVLVEAK